MPDTNTDTNIKNPKATIAVVVTNLTFCRDNSRLVPKDDDALVQFVCAAAEIHQAVMQLANESRGPGVVRDLTPEEFRAELPFESLDNLLTACVDNLNVLSARDVDARVMNGIELIEGAVEQMRVGVDGFRPA